MRNQLYWPPPLPPDTTKGRHLPKNFGDIPGMGNPNARRSGGGDNCCANPNLCGGGETCNGCQCMMTTRRGGKKILYDGTIIGFDGGVQRQAFGSNQNECGLRCRFRWTI